MALQSGRQRNNNRVSLENRQKHNGNKADILCCNSNWSLKQFTVISVRFPLLDVFKSRLNFKKQCNSNHDHLLNSKWKLTLVRLLAKVMQNIR